MPSGDGAGGRSGGDGLGVLRYSLHAASSMSGTRPAGRGCHCEVSRACAMTGTFPWLLHFEAGREVVWGPGHPPSQGQGFLLGLLSFTLSLQPPSSFLGRQQVQVECRFQSGVRPHWGS